MVLNFLSMSGISQALATNRRMKKVARDFSVTAEAALDGLQDIANQYSLPNKYRAQLKDNIRQAHKQLLHPALPALRSSKRQMQTAVDTLNFATGTLNDLKVYGYRTQRPGLAVSARELNRAIGAALSV